VARCTCIAWWKLGKSNPNCPVHQPAAPSSANSLEAQCLCSQAGGVHSACPLHAPKPERRDEPREWTVWRAKPEVDPDPINDYAVRSPGYYNDERFDKIATLIEKSAYDALKWEHEVGIRAYKEKCEAFDMLRAERDEYVVEARQMKIELATWRSLPNEDTVMHNGIVMRRVDKELLDTFMERDQLRRELEEAKRECGETLVVLDQVKRDRDEALAECERLSGIARSYLAAADRYRVALEFIGDKANYFGHDGKEAHSVGDLQAIAQAALDGKEK